MRDFCMVKQQFYLFIYLISTDLHVAVLRVNGLCQQSAGLILR